MVEIKIREEKDYVVVNFKIMPRSKKDAVLGIHDGAIKISLTTPPVDGKANQALIKFLSKKLKLSKNSIEIVQGQLSRYKVLKFQGIMKSEFLEKIGFI